ncbi:glutamyl-tRNA amidotransferase [Triangularia verruculosa]|uniref:Glutamyl-tRNA amidotransferase n=1 Tax=Triangularia verruculosa TaxID=2587418 RepID=A0AAN6X9I9_9PEZI|nr:glutamyl-tRNA amidotransferase [Triangularia verruculosa]
MQLPFAPQIIAAMSLREAFTKWKAVHRHHAKPLTCELHPTAFIPVLSHSIAELRTEKWSKNRREQTISICMSYKSSDESLHYLVRLNDVVVPDLRKVRFGKPVAHGFSPATVVHMETVQDLRAKITKFTSDKEFEERFFGVTVIVTSNFSCRFIKAVGKVLEQHGCRSIFVITTKTAKPSEGPYFVQGKRLYRTWKLFPDEYEAFQLPTIHEPGSDNFIGITVTIEGNLMIPVPSRLHFQRTKEKPLSGVRFTVKDIIDLKGVKTTGQSRSYDKLYGPRDSTATVVTRLVGLGAIIIGKTKCTQFASSDQPTADWIDYTCPWNPRGDGYLSPRGSSTGTCVAVAGYSWCDAGIGSDTGGSIRGPASVMGLWALRPTHSREWLDGIMPLVQGMDTPGLTCRDAKLFHDVCVHLGFGERLDVPPVSIMSPLVWSGATYEGNIREPQHSWSRRLPSQPYVLGSPPLRSADNCKSVQLLYPLDYWNQWPDGPVKKAMELAVQKVEKHLQTRRTEINLEETWLRDDPHNNHSTLAGDLKDTFMPLLWHGYYENLSGFRQEYENKYGHEPYVHPVIRDCWNRGEKLQVDSKIIQQARDNKKVYSRWLRESILGGGGFNVVMVYPVGDFVPFYRDVYRPEPKDRASAYNWIEREDHQSSLAGVPSVVMPVAQVEQPSKITGGTQKLPVAISLMSSRGTDAQLTKLILKMTKVGDFVGEVKVGKEAF